MSRRTTGSGNRLMAPLVLESPETLIYSGADILREDYSHLQHLAICLVDRIHSAAAGRGTGGSGGDSLLLRNSEDCRIWKQLRRSFSWRPPAILAAESAEAQRQDLLDSVHRMSQLYDLEKSLNATLELDAVTALIPVKAAAMLPCQAIHLWMFDGRDSAPGFDAWQKTPRLKSA